MPTTNATLILIATLALFGCHASSTDESALSQTTMSLFEEDPAHPIPYLDRVDVMRSKNSGGVDLAVIIATPVQADDRSRQRLLRKLENYVALIRSDEFQAKFGEPVVERTSIVVVINRNSDPSTFKLLERRRAPIAEAGIALVVEPKDEETNE